MTDLLQQVPVGVWAVIAVVLLPIIVIFGALGIKLLWGLWPVPLSMGLAGYGIWRLGIEFFWLIAVGVVAGVIGTWLWQKSRMFLAGDRILERGMFLGD